MCVMRNFNKKKCIFKQFLHVLTSITGTYSPTYSVASHKLMRLLHHRSITLLAVIWLHVQQALTTLTHPRGSKKKCRTQPGDPDFPRTEDWASLNSTVEGRLLVVVPSAAYCSRANCTDDQWSNTVSRSQIPGQMIAVSASTE